MKKPTITKLPKSQVEIKAEIAWDTVSGYRDEALKSLQSRISIDGFRDGHAPLAMVAQHVGDAAVLEEQASLAISESYPVILTEGKVEALGRPSIVITKLADGNDLEFTATTDVLPTVVLGDYKKAVKKIFEEKTDAVVTDEEMDRTILELRQMRAHSAMHDDGVDHDNHDHKAIPESELPVFDDAFVKTLGAFESIEDFKKKLHENLLRERESAAFEKKRAEALDVVVESATIEMPEVLVSFELDKMVQQMTHDLMTSGMGMDDYLKHIGKTIEDLRTTWHDTAEKRAKMQLVIDTIAEQEKLAPGEDEIESQAEKIMEQYKDQKDISESRVRAYVTQILTNQKVFDFLEGK
ncbi:MAG: hypothetical protein KBC98_00215 [Candidatus Pacebacteria bacterium]|nr:hypothetical protein [Candidatus Paceibacterota bacterium]